MTELVVGLLWHSLDSPNLGVSALTHAQIHLVEQAAAVAGAQPRFIVIGWTREAAAAAGGPVAAVCQINTKRLLGLDSALRRALDECDLVLDIGEGDSFSDIYGWKRLIFLIGSKLLAAGKGRRLVLSPQTLGPFTNPWAARLADLAMRRASLVCARDGLSTQYFRSRALTTPFLEATDVAFALPFEAETKAAGTLRVGVNVSGLLWAGGYSGANQFGLALDYRETMLALVRAFAAHDGVQVILVPHVVTGDRVAEDDLRASQEVAAACPGTQLAGPFRTPMQAKGCISGLDFFVGARMHACIAAFSAGVPCVPMAYSRKFTGLFGSLGYDQVADCTREDQAAVLARVANAFERRAALAEQVARGNELARSRLNRYGEALEQIIREVVRG